LGRPGAEWRTLVTIERDKTAAQLSTLSEITSECPPEPVRRILEAAKEELGMEVAFVSEVAHQLAED
jgi:hypothetical protein